MAQRIFISYRRDDSRGYAGRLQGDLSRRYSDEHVFRDIEIPPGADFGEYITSLVDKCNVVLAIIGPGWLDARDREGERRLDNPEDWVRLEIERALARDGVEVIPVLVDGARLPPREELPESLLALRRRNAFELSDRRWDYDVEELGKHLDGLLRGTSALHVRPAGVGAAPTPTPDARTSRPAHRSRPTTRPPPSSPRRPSRSSPPSPPTSSPATWSTARRWIATTCRRSATSSWRRRSSSASPGALAALAVGFLSRRSREPVVSFLLGLGAGVVAGAVYAGAYAGLTFSSAEGTDTASTAVGMIAAGAFLGWAFGAERAGRAAGGLLRRPGRRTARGRRGRPAARVADHGRGPPTARGAVHRGHRRGRRLRRPAHPARLDRARGGAAHARSSSATGHAPLSSATLAPSPSSIASRSSSTERQRPGTASRAPSQSRTGTTTSTSPPRR